MSFIDGVGARIAAGAVFVLCASSLAYIHRDDLFPPPAEPAAADNPPLAACLSERVGAVDDMREKTTLTPAQYAMFRKRAEDYCYGQFGGAGPPLNSR